MVGLAKFDDLRPHLIKSRLQALVHHKYVDRKIRAQAEPVPNSSFVCLINIKRHLYKALDLRDAL